MRLVSVNVGLPVLVDYEDNKVATGIFKSSVAGPVSVEETNLAGDEQADLRVHGGPDKSVYAYSLDHYEFWRKELNRSPLPHGQFGENLTIAALDETTSCIGDYLAIGTAMFAITQPRVPCFKLGIRFGDMSMPKRFSQAARTGFYLKVLQTGSVRAGDEVKMVRQGIGGVSVRELFIAYLNPQAAESKSVLLRAAQVPELAQEWKEKIVKRYASG